MTEPLIPTSVFSLRLTDNLRQIMEHNAQSLGISAGEWVRGLIQHAGYGQAMGITDGYLQGRSLGLATAIRYLHEAFKNLPDTPEEAEAFFKASMEGLRANREYLKNP